MARELLQKLIEANQRASTYVKTPFDIAVENGFRGSVADWLESLRGARGEQGQRGPKGDTVVGKAGDQGPRGPEGPEGPIGPMPKHEWRGTELRFEIESGEWGDFVDLQGKPGRDGAGGGGAGSVSLAINGWFPQGW